MTKFSKPKTENVISAKDRQVTSSAVYQWITATEHLKSVASSVGDATLGFVIMTMDQIASDEQRIIAKEIPGLLRRVTKNVEKDVAERERLINKYASLLKEQGDRKAGRNNVIAST